MKIFKQIKVSIYSGCIAESAAVPNEGRARFEINGNFIILVKICVQMGTYLLNRINKVNKTCCQSLETQMLSTAQVYASDNLSRKI